MQYLLLIFLLLVASVLASPLNGNHSEPSRCEDSIRATDEYNRVNISTSPFHKIMDVYITTPEVVHSTPAAVLVGKEDGSIVRCLYENPSECEIVHKVDTEVLSLLVSGYNFYAGLQNGTILRCRLYEEDSCTLFYTFESPVTSLVTAKGYLYAGTQIGILSKCHMHRINSCQPLHKFEVTIWSLVYVNESIYAGLGNGELMRCPQISTDCNLIYKMSTSITALLNMGDSIIAGTWDGLVWNCYQKSNANDLCVSKKGCIQPNSMTTINGKIYIVEYKKAIYDFDWTDGDVSLFQNIEDANCVAFVHGTYEMQSRFKNENKTCKLQRGSLCPPYVTYYDEQERAAFEVQVKEGKLYNSLGVLVDTSDADVGRSGRAAIFAMGPDGTILLSNLHKQGLLHTSSFFAGNPVAGAGEMVVKNGVIQRISACSEHYQPDLNLNRQVVQSLRSQGYTEPITSQICSEENSDTIEENNVQ